MRFGKWHVFSSMIVFEFFFFLTIIDIVCLIVRINFFYTLVSSAIFQLSHVPQKQMYRYLVNTPKLKFIFEYLPENDRMKRKIHFFRPKPYGTNGNNVVGAATLMVVLMYVQVWGGKNNFYQTWPTVAPISFSFILSLSFGNHGPQRVIKL